MRGDRVTREIHTGIERGSATREHHGRGMGSGMQENIENRGGGRNREHVEEELRNLEIRGKQQEYSARREEEPSFESTRIVKTQEGKEI